MTMDTNREPDAGLLWRDIADMPENQPVLAKFRAWNKPDGEQMQHVVWLFEGKVRPYPKTDEEAYADAWKPLPGQDHERSADADEIDRLRAKLVAANEREARWKDLATNAIDCLHDVERETDWGQPTFGPSVWERFRDEQNELMHRNSKEPII